MSFCPNCGTETPAGAAVCPKCNTALSAGSGGPPGGMADGPVQAAKTSGLAIASLVLGILGICSYGLLGLVGLIMGLVALSKINQSGGQLGGKGLAIGGIATGAATLLLGVLMMVAIAVPNFLKFQAKAKQAEAKTNLGAIFTAEIAHFGERNTYATTFDEIGWAPAGNNLYTYYLPDDVVPSASGQTYPLPSGVEPVAGDSLRVVAVGNIDNDDTLDVWTINNMKQLINVVNDVLQ